MKKWLMFLLLGGCMAIPAYGQDAFPSYFERTEYLMTSPGAMKYGLYGFQSPAMVGLIEEPDLQFNWSDRDGFTEFNRWGLFAGVPHAGFAAVRSERNGVAYNHYRLSAAFGGPQGATGVSYGWFGGDADQLGFGRTVALSTLSRPVPHLSFGGSWTRSLDSEDYDLAGELALRPFGNEWLSVAGEYAFDRHTDWTEGRWALSAGVEPLPGVRLAGRYFDGGSFTAGLQLSFGRGGVSTQTHFDQNQQHGYNTYGIRAGAYDRTLVERLPSEQTDVVEIDVSGRMTYQRYRYMDGSPELLATLDRIERTSQDPAANAILLNTTGMQMDGAQAWEIRDRLEAFQRQGGRVVAYVERGGMNTFRLASVADQVVMDPYGGLLIPGYAMGSTYLADLLDTIGIGVDEFREMEYKSAFETFSRTGMSEADREQRQALVDGFYEQTRNDVVDGRPLDEQSYEELIDRGIALRPAQLVEAGIVDTLARFEDIDGVLADLDADYGDRMSPEKLPAYRSPGDDLWGKRPRVAVVYAEGGTSVEGGYNGRALARYLKKARSDDQVKAVVLRADSPGGDVLGADLVAEEVRKTAEEKPIIVTQGAVAASGGYWISMHGDRIVAAPNTITGSIGVIGGWFYDDGLTDHVRLHTDEVQRGRSADLMTGPVLPLLNLPLPGRDLTGEERELLIDQLLHTYDDFIERVAEARDRDPEEIRELAAGRVYTGRMARENGLVDEIGSLYTALDMALEEAGIDPQERYEIVEYPQPDLFNLAGLLPVPGIGQWLQGAGGGLAQVSGDKKPETRKDPMQEYLELMVENRGEPMVILPMAQYEWYYRLHGLDGMNHLAGDQE